MAKKKKDKITYIDDGRTIADMSNVTRTSAFIPQSFMDGGRKGTSGGDNNDNGSRNGNRPRSWERGRASLKEQLGTFWAAVKMMLPITLVVVMAIIGVYLLIYLIALVK